jgi:hypothetical protein
MTSMDTATLSLNGYKPPTADARPDLYQLTNTVKYGSSLQSVFSDWQVFLRGPAARLDPYTVAENGPLSLYTAAGFYVEAAPSAFAGPDIAVTFEAVPEDYPLTYGLGPLRPPPDTRVVVVYVSFASARREWDASRTRQFCAFFETPSVGVVCVGPRDADSDMPLGEQSLAVFSAQVADALETVASWRPEAVVLVTSAPRAYAFMLGRAARSLSADHNIDVHTAELIGATVTKDAVTGGEYEIYPL